MDGTAHVNADHITSSTPAQGDATGLDEFIQQLVQGGPHGDHPDGGDSSVTVDNEEDEVLNFYKGNIHEI